MTIQEFYNDRETHDAVKDYLIAFLTDYGVKKMFKGEPTESVGEAKKIVDEAFDNLELQFGSKQEPEKKKIPNPAR